MQISLVDLALKTLTAAVVARLWERSCPGPIREIDLSRIFGRVPWYPKRLRTHVAVVGFAFRVRTGAGKTTGASKSNAACTGAFAETFLDDLAMNTHPTTICTRLTRDIHAIDPSWKVSEVIRAHHSRVRQGVVKV
jgi:hypothetical protein